MTQEIKIGDFITAVWRTWYAHGRIIKIKNGIATIASHLETDRNTNTFYPTGKILNVKVAKIVTINDPAAIIK